MNIRVQVDGQVYEVEIGDLNTRPIQAVVGGELFDVWPEEVADSLAAAPGMEATTTPAAPRPQAISLAGSAPGQVEIVASPLPGDIVAVAVRAGDAVTAGQLLCTVESMKMNNPVRSPRAAIVEEVMVTVGTHVNHGQPMMRLR